MSKCLRCGRPDIEMGRRAARATLAPQPERRRRQPAFDCRCPARRGQAAALFEGVVVSPSPGRPGGPGKRRPPTA
eukprot:11211566-Lingulodinium_polyedra.AAC.1